MGKQKALFLGNHTSNGTRIVSAIVRVEELFCMDSVGFEHTVQVQEFGLILHGDPNEVNVRVQWPFIGIKPVAVFDLGVSPLDSLLVNREVPARDCVEVHFIGS